MKTLVLALFLVHANGMHHVFFKKRDAQGHRIPRWDRYLCGVQRALFYVVCLIILLTIIGSKL